MTPDANGTAPKFEAEKHLVNLNPNGPPRMYLETKWRLVWLRSEHPDAHVETAIHQYDTQTAVVTARIELPKTGAVATGIGTAETKNSSKFSGRILEKAETAAVGRACAALGYGTQHSGGDYEDGGNVADTPRQRSGAKPTAEAIPLDDDEKAQRAFWANQKTRKLEPRDKVYQYLGIANDVEKPLTTYWLEPCEAAGMSRAEAYRLADSLIGRVREEAKKAREAGDPHPGLTALSVVEPLAYIKSAPVEAPA